MYYIVRLLLGSQTLVSSNQCMKLWEKLLIKWISAPTNVLTSSFLQSTIVRLILNLLKSRDTIAMFQWSTAFDAFPLWQSRIF